MQGKFITQTYENLVKNFVNAIKENDEASELKPYLNSLQSGAQFGIKIFLFLEGLLKKYYPQRGDMLVQRYVEQFERESQTIGGGGGIKPISIKVLDFQSKLMSLPLSSFLNVLKTQAFKSGGIEHLPKDDVLFELVREVEIKFRQIVEDLLKNDLVGPASEIVRVIFEHMCGFLVCEDKAYWQKLFVDLQKQKKDKQISLLLDSLQKGDLRALRTLYDILSSQIDKFKKGDYSLQSEIQTLLQKVDELLSKLPSDETQRVFALNFYGKLYKLLDIGGSNAGKGLIGKLSGMFQSQQSVPPQIEELKEALLIYIKKYNNEQSSSEK